MARGNQAADQAAKRAALQNHDLIGVATLAPQNNLPKTPSYTEDETLKVKSEGFQEDHTGWFQKERKKVKVKLLSHVRLFATPWTLAYQAPPSMGFSRQEYWSGLPFKEFPGKLVCGTKVSTPIKSLFCNTALLPA